MHPVRVWLRNPFFWAALAGVVTIPLIRPLLRHVPDPPPVLFQLPRYVLTDQDGRRFGSDDLRGKVYLVSFFFTTCPSICPRLMNALLSLQRRYERYDVDVQLVSITVDPETDRPAQLRHYADRLGADPARWRLLTGTPEQVRQLVVEAFKSHVGEKRPDERGVMDIAHTGEIGLVDQTGGFRGFYRTDAEGLDELFHRSIHVRFPQ